MPTYTTQFETIYMPLYPAQLDRVDIYDVITNMKDVVRAGPSVQWVADSRNVPGQAALVKQYINDAFKSVGLDVNHYSINFNPDGTCLVRLTDPASGRPIIADRGLTSYQSYVYTAALGKQYPSNATKKAIYLVPHPIGKVWVNAAAAVPCEPQSGKSFIPSPNPTTIKKNAAQALCDVYGFPHCTNSNCIWQSGGGQGITICNDHYWRLFYRQQYTAKCDVCQNYVYPRFDYYGTRLGVWCPYCSPVSPVIQGRRYFCPTCKKFRICDCIGLLYGVPLVRCQTCRNDIYMTFHLNVHGQNQSFYIGTLPFVIPPVPTNTRVLGIPAALSAPPTTGLATCRCSACGYNWIGYIRSDATFCPKCFSLVVQYVLVGSPPVGGITHLALHPDSIDLYLSHDVITGLGMAESAAAAVGFLAMAVRMFAQKPIPTVYSVWLYDALADTWAWEVLTYPTFALDTCFLASGWLVILTIALAALGAVTWGMLASDCPNGIIVSLTWVPGIPIKITKQPEPIAPPISGPGGRTHYYIT